VALDCIREVRPSLILLDLLMPEMDGFEFLDELRRDEKWCSIPVVVVTAKDVTFEDRQRLQGSVQRVIQKANHTGDDLVREVRSILAPIGRQESASGS
jgi:CheY-like chemotaxis protein